MASRACSARHVLRVNSECFVNVANWNSRSREASEFAFPGTAAVGTLTSSTTLKSDLDTALTVTRSLVFQSLWLFLSVLDGYLALHNRDVLASEELNPVGQALLELGDGQVWYLLAAKFGGTVIAGTLVLLIHQGYPRWSVPIAGAVAAAGVIAEVADGQPAL